jgi:hypothetical protein
VQQTIGERKGVVVVDVLRLLDACGR